MTCTESAGGWDTNSFCLLSEIILLHLQEKNTSITVVSPTPRHYLRAYFKTHAGSQTISAHAMESVRSSELVTPKVLRWKALRSESPKLTLKTLEHSSTTGGDRRGQGREHVHARGTTPCFVQLLSKRQPPFFVYRF